MISQSFVIAVAYSLCMLLATAHGAAPDSFDGRKFQQLPLKDRVTAIVAASEMREGQIQSFSCTFSHEVASVNLKTKQRAVAMSGTFQMKRKGSVLRMACPDYRINGRFESDFAQRWDGSESRTLSKRASGRLEGNISDQPPPAYADCQYKNMLGMSSMDGTTTPAKWIAEADGKMRKLLDADLIAHADKQLIRLHVLERGFVHMWFWFDPDRGSMLVKYELRHTDGKKTYNWEVFEVTKAEQINGCWIPIAVTGRSGIGSEPDLETEWIDNVSHFEIGGVEDKELAVDFPVGTRVHDKIRRVMYFVEPDGKQRQVPLYDPAAGRVMGPG